MQMKTHMLIFAAMLMVAAILDLNVPSASANIIEPHFFISCTTSGQMCDPPFSTTVQTDSILRVQYFVPHSHCSPLRLHISVDGTPVLTTASLGWFGAPTPFNALPLTTGIVNLGPVSPGTHTISTQAEGQIGGCNTGTLVSWAGDVQIITDPYSLSFFENGNPSDLVVGINQPITAVADTTDSSINQVTFKWVNPIGNVVREVTKPVLSSPEDTFTLNNGGLWTVEADFQNGVVLRQTLDVPFMVLPESPIGTLAMIVSSLSALGVFAIVRYKKKD